MVISKKLYLAAKSPLGALIVGFAFGKLSTLLPVKKIIETDKVVAFWHPKPIYEKHILIVPKKGIKNLTLLKESDREYIDEVFVVAKKIVEDLGLEKEEYRIIMNGGKNQEINQLHFHLISGEEI